MTATPSLDAVLPRAGETALIVGLGQSAVALARFLHARSVYVRVCDVKPEPELAEYTRHLPPATQIHAGGYGNEVLDGVAAVFASPGVPWHGELLEGARRRTLPVSSEMDLFFRLCPAEMIGITGTNGKTTTTALAGHILARGPKPVMVGGNIGETVLDRLEEVTPEHLVVLELSSFQIESIESPHVHMSVVLNITPDHLDRHGTFDAYVDAKARLVEYQSASDYAVLNGRDEVCRSLASRTPAEVVWFDRHQPVPPRIPLPGAHNLENVLAAATVARLAGLDDSLVADAVADFRGVEHRLERVGEWNGVRWYNDSKATNPDAALMGLRAVSGPPLVLIAGGYGGGFEVDPWLDEVARSVQAVVLIGQSATELAPRLGRLGVRVAHADSMEAAVAAADRLVPADGVVLLSPGYKSYDMFRNFEERGRVFKRAVLELKQR